MNIPIALRRAVIGGAVLGVVFAKTAFATPAATAPFSTNESWSSCTESLCIDAPPQGRSQDGPAASGFGV